MPISLFTHKEQAKNTANNGAILMKNINNLKFAAKITK